jgi:hypothetical protein
VHKVRWRWGGGVPLLPMNCGFSSTCTLAAVLVTVHQIMVSPSSNFSDNCSSPFFTPRYRVLLLGGILSSAVMRSLRYGLYGSSFNLRAGQRLHARACARALILSPVGAPQVAVQHAVERRFDGVGVYGPSLVCSDAVGVGADEVFLCVRLNAYNNVFKVIRGQLRLQFGATKLRVQESVANAHVGRRAQSGDRNGNGRVDAHDAACEKGRTRGCCCAGTGGGGGHMKQRRLAMRWRCVCVWRLGLGWRGVVRA